MITRRIAALVLVLPVAGFLFAGDSRPQTSGKKTEPAAGKSAAPAALPSGTISLEMWQKASTAPLQPGEIDQLLNAELKKANITPAPLINDELFIRRVTLDLTGGLPSQADVSAFLADKSPDKRAKVIDRLLASDAYARHWARYWREVIASRSTEQTLRILAPSFDRWMAEQLRANKSWADIARALITATGEVRFLGGGKGGGSGETETGPAFFLLARRGADATTERAAETSRIFLGVQIQCAQCHDHPSDVWKRQQFHEFAAHFARVRDRFIIEEKRIVGVALVSLPFGEYQMDGGALPKLPKAPKGFKGPKGGKGAGGLQPRFLDGKATGIGLSDEKRRGSLVAAMTSKDSPWFAAAFVNRMWGEMMGQSFTMPVDDLGPQKDAVFPVVLTRLAGAFRGSNYDVKALFRAILNTQAYQRQIRPGESPEEHILFSAAYPTRLRADALWQALVDVLGPMTGPGPGIKGPKGGFGGGRFGLESLFKDEFAFDPSMRPEEVEGSIPQALLLMNNPQINQKIRATGSNMLGRILSTYSDNDEALRTVYLRALARRPTDRELERCRDYIRTVGNRAEAFEDILWVLINSTEFQTRR
jgi:hypothetical protein